MWHIFSRSLIVGAYLAITAAVVLVVSSVVFGRIVSVQTNSMQPTFKAGDALLMSSNIFGLMRGDIITYRDARNPSQTISHRIMRVSGDTFFTSGDAQRGQIAKVSKSDVIGKTVIMAPRFGIVMDFVRSWPGMFLSVYLPAVLIITTEIWNLSRQMHRPKYLLHTAKR